MRPWLIPFLAVTLWIGVAFDHALSNRWTILGAHPDLLLVFVGVIGLYLPMRGSLVYGFLAGAVFGGVGGGGLGSFSASRLLGSLVPSLANSIDLDRNLLAAVLSAVVTTLVSQVFLLFLDPPASILTFVGATIRTALYDGVLAIPVFYAVHPILDPVARRK